MSSLFISYIQSDPWFYFSWVVIVMFSVCVHEYSHAITALRFGDDTAEASGHLTLDPLVQLGPISLGVLVFFGIAWGAVPINPSRLSRGEMGVVALAGPLANLALCLLAGLLAAVVGLEFWGGEGLLKAAEFLQFACVANGVLFLFNMLPVPLLDGWKVLGMFYHRIYDIKEETANMITTMFFIVVFVGPTGAYIWIYGRRLGAAVIAIFDGLFRLVGLA